MTFKNLISNINELHNTLQISQTLPDKFKLEDLSIQLIKT